MCIATKSRKHSVTRDRDNVQASFTHRAFRAKFLNCAECVLLLRFFFYCTIDVKFPSNTTNEGYARKSERKRNVKCTCCIREGTNHRRLYRISATIISTFIRLRAIIAICGMHIIIESTCD